MRLFVAVRPPAPVLDLVEDLLAGMRNPAGWDPTGRGPDERVRWTPRENFHVTLRFLGQVEDPGAVVEALAGVGGDLGPVEATLGPAVGRLGPQVVCVPVGGVDGLAGAVTAATEQLGQPPKYRPFRAHLTLARLPRGDGCLGGYLEKWVGLPIGARWPVGEVEVVRSHLGPGGSRYETVAEVALPASPVG